MPFGDRRFQDYTIHKTEERKQRYIDRHKDNENHTKSGIETAGFMSRWILWNQPTIQESIKDTNKRFHINMKLL